MRAGYRSISIFPPFVRALAAIRKYLSTPSGYSRGVSAVMQVLDQLLPDAGGFPPREGRAEARSRRQVRSRCMRNLRSLSDVFMPLRMDRARVSLP
jgi:hypothetical protein